jgi:DNA repair exonuclease SbcCD ATPase subunit
MAELAKGISDEHMNAEALAEAARSQDARAGLDEIEDALARGDLDEALKALDRLGGQMEELLAGMERTAGRPGERNRELARELRALKKELDGLEAGQKAVAAETERDRGAYQREVRRRLRDADARIARLAQLAAEARRRVDEARPGVTLRSEHDHEVARERLAELERALGGKDLDAALESARRAVPPVERLSAGLAEDLALAQRFPQPGADPQALRDASAAAAQAVPPARAVREELEKLFPDPGAVLPRESQARLDRQAREQEELARRADELRERMGRLAEQAPIFPPEAGESLREAHGQMQGAAGELARRDPQRGHGRQRQALDALARLRAGMEGMARQGQARGEGQGMPVPFAMQSGGREEGDGLEPSPEKVEIPGAEAYKAPEEFRKDLMEAMKQGAPEKYKGEVSRYYQELVK